VVPSLADASHAPLALVFIHAKHSISSALLLKVAYAQASHALVTSFHKNPI